MCGSDLEHSEERLLSILSCRSTRTHSLNFFHSDSLKARDSLNKLVEFGRNSIETLRSDRNHQFVGRTRFRRTKGEKSVFAVCPLAAHVTCSEVFRHQRPSKICTAVIFQLCHGIVCVCVWRVAPLNTGDHSIPAGARFSQEFHFILHSPVCYFLPLFR